MSLFRIVSASRTGPRVLQVVVLACLVAASAGGAFAGDGGSPGDAPDERQNAQQLAAGETIEANLSDGDDVDWYAVNATAGEAVVGTLALSNASGNRSVEVNVYDSSGQLATEEERDKMSGPQRVAGERPGSTEEQTAHAPDVAEATGTYYVEVRESPWNETDDGVSSSYNLTVTTGALDEYDPNENGSSATPIEVGQSIEAVATPYDHDVYAVDLTAGANYTVAFNLTNAPAGRYSKMMTLHTDASAVTDDDPPDGTWGYEMVGNASATLTAEEDGTHYLRIGQSGITATLLERAPYRLTITRTDSSTDGANDETSSGTEDGTDGETDSEPETDGTADGDDASSDGTETGDSGDSEAIDEGIDVKTTNGTVTVTDAGPGSVIDGDTTATRTGTTVRGGGGGSGEVTATGSPTEGAGPGFGVGLALGGLLGVGLRVHRERRAS